ncbi:MAG: AmmeMemoRadiSam system protein A [Deltaproteobacteria bacterium]|nr:AmmeMemoRadiSam system protein A [Deltaproteobacteria bacterium]
MLSAENKKILLNIARRTIETHVKEKKAPAFSTSNPELLEKSGAFVSLHKNHDLRGCIGIFTSEKPLYQTIVDMAVSASSCDPRFVPVSVDELPEISIEISVLTPMKRIYDVSEIEVGRHGIYIIKGRNRGVLLPQVATEYNWDRETFLDHTCLKAGLAQNSWKQKDVEIYTFEAEVFGEGE